MKLSVEREKVRFSSGDTECAAWHYPGSNGACVVMAGGFAVTKEPATDLFAKRFCDAGFAVLAFDYRRLGESGGQPRQVVNIREQLADWHAAIGFAATLPGVDPTRLAIWGFSASGGHVLRVAASSPGLAAAIAQTPNADGQAAARNAARHQKPLAMLRLTGLGAARCPRRPGQPPAAAGAAGRRAGNRRDAHDAGRSGRRQGAQPGQQVPGLAAGGRRPLGAPPWSFYRPGRDAPRVRCPLLVLVCDQDQSALAGPAAERRRRRRRRSWFAWPGGHYAPFLDGHEQAVQAELSFLRRHLLGSRTSNPAHRRGFRAAPRQPAMKQVELSAGTIEYQDTSGDGPVLVLLHGLMMDASLWDGPIADLSADHRCVAPTLPLGAHRHAMHPGADLSLPGIARLVAELLDRLDLQDVTLIGNDTGGALVQLLIGDGTARVGRAVLASCDAFDNFPPGLTGKTLVLAGKLPPPCSGCSCSRCGSGQCGGSRSRSGG